MHINFTLRKFDGSLQSKMTRFLHQALASATKAPAIGRGAKLGQASKAGAHDHPATELRKARQDLLAFLVEYILNSLVHRKKLTTKLGALEKATTIDASQPPSDGELEIIAYKVALAFLNPGMYPLLLQYFH